MLTVLFVLWLLYVTGTVAGIALRAGWGILKFGITVIFLPLTMLGLLIGGIIHLTVPILVIIGIVTLVKQLTYKGVL